MIKTPKIIILTTLLLLTGCKPAEETNLDQQAAERIMTAAAATVQAGGEEAEPTATDTPVPEEVAPMPTRQPDYESPATVTSETLNLRSGPGTLFSIIQNYGRGTQVTTLEMTPDGRWIRVAAPGAEGWMAADYLDLSELQAALPIVKWPRDFLIWGTVLDKQKNPVNGARLAATSGDLRVEAITTVNGNFYIYLPSEVTGPFNLEIVAIHCDSTISEILEDGSCIVRDYFPIKWQETIYLPQTEPTRFYYEAGIAFLEGIVAYQDGNGASQILVRATRLTDEVQSEFVTPVGGEFRLPLGKGIWEIVAVRFQQDGTPLVSETYTYKIYTLGEELDPLTIPYNEIIDRN